MDHAVCLPYFSLNFYVTLIFISSLFAYHTLPTPQSLLGKFLCLTILCSDNPSHIIMGPCYYTHLNVCCFIHSM